MVKFSANLSLLFTEVPLIERFKRAAASGFSAVEIQFPYELSIDEIKHQLEVNQLTLDLINMPAGDWSAGDRGIACDPSRQDEFKEAVRQSLQYAQMLGCKQINCLSGIVPKTLSPEFALATLKGNLRYANDELAKHQVCLNIEAINTTDVPGFMLHHSHQVVNLIKELGLNNTYLQFDVYHMEIMEGHLIDSLHSLLPYIGHIQIADVPGRHQPGTGQINFHCLFKELGLLGYTGRIALEFNPLGNTEASLDWMNAYL
ncbi:MAG: TIM barrel protein [Motiliproteus sp.]